MAPRYLRSAGDSRSATEVRDVASRVTGTPFRLFRAGGLGRLNAVIRVARFVAPAETSLYPAWQGMQDMRDMMEGRAEVRAHDNERYPGLEWTSVEAFLTASRARGDG